MFITEIPVNKRARPETSENYFKILTLLIQLVLVFTVSLQVPWKDIRPKIPTDCSDWAVLDGRWVSEGE